MSTATSHGALRIGGSLLAALAAGALLAAAPAHAAGATSAVCTTVFTASVSPGFSLKPSTGTLSSMGEVGRLTCVGTIDGRRITGPGTLGIHYVYAPGATCVSHKGAGTVHFTLPTTAGSRHIVGALTVRRAGLVFSAKAQFPAGRLDGIGVVAPASGDCLLTPVRRVLVSATGSLSSARTTAAAASGARPGERE